MSETRSVAVVGTFNERCKYGIHAFRAFREYDWRVARLSFDKATTERLAAYCSADTIATSLDVVMRFIRSVVEIGGTSQMLTHPSCFQAPAGSGSMPRPLDPLF